ncbi:hypothetical protein DVH24_011115 [Malus domestica]|uniref:Uncharacterized protein n=1 Tax=Malus domestica TaxID=3750 RepID=A0A498JTJ9_MALDO|nr:hypothetical protein DVH24_011115 [Malus domestica]
MTRNLIAEAIALKGNSRARELRSHLHDGYLGYDPRLSSQRFDSFVDSKLLKDSATDSPIFHDSVVDDAFATQPASDFAGSTGDAT